MPYAHPEGAFLKIDPTSITVDESCPSGPLSVQGLAHEGLWVMKYNIKVSTVKR
jgi:hypothetical protein